MKRILLAFIIFLALAGAVFAENKCISSGLLTADAQVMTRSGDSWRCLCGVVLLPAAAASTLILYDNASAAGTVLYKGSADASGLPTGFPPSDICINVDTGIYADVSGADAAYIIWYRE